jgi:hypothetical protein
MPCRSYETDWVHEKPRSTEVAVLKMEADKLARIACRAMELLEKSDPTLKGMNAEARNWYAKHKKADEARKAAEAKVLEKKRLEAQLRQDALAKLTPEEIKAFGIKV